MRAIFKRELKSYLTSMVGYLFIFFVLVLTGIYFSAYQLSGGYSKFETTLSALTFVFLIGVPILSMRVLAEERKQKTDQLLLTAPVSVGYRCQQNLAAQVTGLLKQRDFMAALGRHAGSLQTGDAAADDGDLFGRFSGLNKDGGFVAVFGEIGRAHV